MKIDDLKPKDITSAMKDIHDMVNPKVDTNIRVDNNNTQENNMPMQINIIRDN